MTDGANDLFEQAESFAVDLSITLQSTLPDAPAAIAAVAPNGRVLVRPEERVPLSVKGVRLAALDVHVQCELDSRGTWLAVEDSKISISAMADRTPIFRFEYVRGPRTSPSAHVQVHAHRGP